MLWRLTLTAVIWVLGFGVFIPDGQIFRDAVVMLVAVVVASLPWIRLAFSKRGTRGRVVAILIVSLSAIAVVWIAWGLPQAHDFERRFNALARGP